MSCNQTFNQLKNMADNTDKEPVVIRKVINQETLPVKLFLPLASKLLTQTEKLKIWKYIIMHNTEERKTGNHISGNF